MSPLTGDTSAAIDFLKRWYGDRIAWLSAKSVSEASMETDFFNIRTEEDRLRSWLDARQGKANIYFTVNIPDASYKNKSKPAKDKIGSAFALHVDIDPREGEDIASEKARAQNLLSQNPYPPSVLIDSGGGVQGFWFLDEIYSTPTETERDFVESKNKAFELAYTGDHCWNIDRIMRLPGTVNIPDEKKRSKGRVDAVAKLLEFHEDRRYKIDLFIGRATTERSNGNVVQLKPMGDLPIHVDLAGIKELHDHVKKVIQFGYDPDSTQRWRSRSEAVHWVAIQCRRVNMTAEAVASILMDSQYRISDSVLEQKNPKNYAQRQVRRAEERGGIVDKGAIIEVVPGSLPIVIDRAEEAIVKSGTEIYQRMGTLIRVVRDGEESILKTIEVSPHWLLEQMSVAARWIQRFGRETREINPTLDFSKHYIARRGSWNVPELNGAVSAPTLRRDFSVLATPGYDAQSGLYYDPGRVSFPPVPDHPTQDDARAALNILVQPIRAFPFTPDNADADWLPGPNEGLQPSAARSVVLSAFITGVIRPALPTAPFHAIDAADAGTGKSKLTDVISTVITGGKAPMMSLGEDEDEGRKKMLSVLMGAPRMVVIDNISRPIEGDALCIILTQETWQDRLLGQSSIVSVPTNVLFVGTGNNITFKGDMTRRAVLARMDARTDNPEERQFDFDAVAEAMRDRAKIVVACLTMVQAYVKAGRPVRNQVKDIGSFEAWSIVRETLIWLDQPDPARTRMSIKVEDPQRTALIEMMDLWYNVNKREEIKLSSIVSDLKALSATADGPSAQLRDYMASFCQNNRLNIKSMNGWFRKNGGRFVVGRRFVVIKDEEHGTIVRLDCPERVDVPDEEVVF